MKSTRYSAKIMTQNVEKYLKLRKSLSKSFYGFDPSYRMIYLTWLE